MKMVPYVSRPNIDDALLKKNLPISIPRVVGLEVRNVIPPISVFYLRNSPRSKRIRRSKDDRSRKRYRAEERRD